MSLEITNSRLQMQLPVANELTLQLSDEICCVWVRRTSITNNNSPYTRRHIKKFCGSEYLWSYASKLQPWVFNHPPQSDTSQWSTLNRTQVIQLARAHLCRLWRQTQVDCQQSRDGGSLAGWRGLLGCKDNILRKKEIATITTTVTWQQ